MESKTTQAAERRIYFTVPNNINLTSEQWEKQPVNFHIRDIPLYCFWVSAFLGIALLVFLPLNIITVLIWIGSAVVILSIGYYLERTLRRKHRENQLHYRKEYVPLLAELLEANGLFLPEDEQQKLTSTMKHKFKVLNEDGVRYRTAGVDAYGDTLSASFFLADPEAEKILSQIEQEETIARIANAYEAEHGAFGSPELRETFIEGVRYTLR